jgi:hypothetical protein
VCVCVCVCVCARVCVQGVAAVAAAGREEQSITDIRWLGG